MSRWGMVGSWLFEAGWILPWMVALESGAGWWLVAGTLAAGALVPRRWQRWPLWLALLIVSMGAGVRANLPAAVILAPVALWRGWRARYETGGWAPRLVWAAVALGALTIWQPRFDVALATTLLIGVLTMSETARPDGVSGRQWWGLTGGLLVLAIGIAVGIGMVTWWAPWSRVTPYLVNGIIAVLALVFEVLFRLLPRPGRSTTEPVRTPLAALGHRLAHLARHPAHSNHLVTGVLVGLGVAAAVGAAFLAARLWSQWSPPARDADEVLDRETIGPPPVRPTSSLRWTRRVVARRMGQARRHGAGPRPAETLREWLARAYRAVPETVVSTYERIRYAGEPDSAATAEAVDAAWPALRDRASRSPKETGGEAPMRARGAPSRSGRPPAR